MWDTSRNIVTTETLKKYMSTNTKMRRKAAPKEMYVTITLLSTDVVKDKNKYTPCFYLDVKQRKVERTQLDYILFMLMGFTAACYVLDPTNIKKSGIYSTNFKKILFSNSLLTTEDISTAKTFSYFMHTTVTTKIIISQISHCMYFLSVKLNF